MRRLPKVIYTFSVIAIKILMALLTEIEKNNSTICVEPQKTTNRQVYAEKEEKKLEVSYFLYFKTYYKVTVT